MAAPAIADSANIDEQHELETVEKGVKRMLERRNSEGNDSLFDLFAGIDSPVKKPAMIFNEAESGAAAAEHPQQPMYGMEDIDLNAGGVPAQGHAPAGQVHVHAQKTPVGDTIVPR